MDCVRNHEKEKAAKKPSVRQEKTWEAGTVVASDLREELLRRVSHMRAKS